MKLAIILLFISFASISCSKKHTETERTYTADEFARLANAASQVNSTGENAIPFSDYSPGVNKASSKTFIFERLKFYAVQFETEAQARSEAMRLNQYYSRNILFDLVEGEPVLEDYVIKSFQAQNPTRTVQRIPKIEEGHSVHGEVHGSPHSPPEAPASHDTHSAKHQ